MNIEGVTHVGNVWQGSIAILLRNLLKDSNKAIFVVLKRDYLEKVAATLSSFGMGPLVLTDFTTLHLFNRILSSYQVILVPIDVVKLQVACKIESKLKQLSVGSEFDIFEFERELSENGFERVNFVRQPGEFAQRGSVLDVFDFSISDPIRIEIAYDKVESLREFSAEDQQSKKEVRNAVISIPDKMSESSKDFYELIPHDHKIVLHNFNEMEKDTEDIKWGSNIIKTYELPVEDSQTAFNLKTYSLLSLNVDYINKISAVEQLLDQYSNVVVFYKDQRHRERLGSFLKFCRLKFKEGVIWSSFRTDDSVYISSFDLLDKEPNYPVISKRSYDEAASKTFFDFEIGDYVVHKYLGIARFAGLEKVKLNKSLEERIVLEFYNNLRYLVPVQEADIIHKYYAADSDEVTLTNVSGDGWLMTKLKARDDIRMFALQLIEQHAKRVISNKPPLNNQRDSVLKFVDSFEFEDTACQEKAWKEIEGDMEKTKPMDRLICADVGFGKTELACRAAFKTIMNGRQVVLVCPTTVLAYQHYLTFTHRFNNTAGFVVHLSRFLSKSEQKKVIQDLSAGKVDIVIGTHRLLQDNVKFKNLGLVIVDEEQRFGVEQKSQLQKMRESVDLLSLSATPIPRTLHMCLSGLRDISILYTAPKNRKPVITKVARFSKDLIEDAVKKELMRDGQIFIVHNTIGDLDQLAALVRNAVPDDRIAVLHGKLTEEEIENNLVEFIDGKIKVLIATTIIENGIDIPNANTLIVTDSHRYGLSQLHQIRGRIGRETKQSYAYFLFRDNIHGRVVERLKALEEFTELGSGFKIALRDLEIRGAGNMLGREQHGHIRAIGYDLYVQFLHQEIEKLKTGKETVELDPEIRVSLPCFIPQELVDAEDKRLEMYRNIFSSDREEKLESIRSGMRDLFGKLPESIENLFFVQKIKILSRKANISKLISVASGFEVVYGSGKKELFKGTLSQLENKLRESCSKD